MRGYGMACGGLHIYPTAVHASVGPGVLPCPGQVGGGGSAMRGYGMACGGLHTYPTAVAPRQARGPSVPGPGEVAPGRSGMRYATPTGVGGMRDMLRSHSHSLRGWSRHRISGLGQRSRVSRSGGGEAFLTRAVTQPRLGLTART